VYIGIQAARAAKALKLAAMAMTPAIAVEMISRQKNLDSFSRLIQSRLRS
jgi:hypothetical protein